MSVHYLQFKVAQTNTSQSIAAQLSTGATGVFQGTAPARCPFYEVQIQNNAGHDIRVGDSTASVTNNIGILVKSGQTPPVIFKIGTFAQLNADLAQVFISGTQNDLIDILFTK